MEPLTSSNSGEVVATARELDPVAVFENVVGVAMGLSRASDFFDQISVA